MRRHFIPGLDFAAVVLLVLPIHACSSTVSSAGPPAGGTWEPIRELSDEFEGEELDLTRWHDNNPRWEGRPPAFFSKDNVSVGGGKLQLTARAEHMENPPDGFHTFTTAAVKSRIAVKYGYFEIKARPLKAKLVSAFWFYDNTEEEWTEIDVFELCGVGPECTHTHRMNLHVFHTPTDKKHWSNGQAWNTPFDLTEDYHIYGLEWDKEFIRWYVDGKLVREVVNTHWHQPLYMNFNIETQTWLELPDERDLPATFSIEYVRAWHKSGDEPGGGGPGR